MESGSWYFGFQFHQVMLRYRQCCKPLCLIWISYRPCGKGSERVGNLVQVTEEMNSKSGSALRPWRLSQTRAHLWLLWQTVTGAAVMGGVRSRMADVTESQFSSNLVWRYYGWHSLLSNAQWPGGRASKTVGHILPQAYPACEKWLPGIQSHLCPVMLLE